MTIEGKPRPFEPTDAWTYMPFYQGEFVPPPAKEGKVEDPGDPWVLRDPDDPFLYWLIPIWMEMRPIIDARNPDAPPGSLGYQLFVVDCLKEHVRLKTKPGTKQGGGDHEETP